MNPQLAFRELFQDPREGATGRQEGAWRGAAPKSAHCFAARFILPRLLGLPPFQRSLSSAWPRCVFIRHKNGAGASPHQNEAERRQNAHAAKIY